jgi:glycosyltransferase involved in cell wall biosynthesis
VEDVDDFDCCHLTDEMQKPYNKIRILYFGLIRAGKGLQTILRVFEDNEIAKKFSLHITGDLPAMAGMSDKKLFEIVQTQRAWKYHGYLSFKELQSMFHETDLVLLPFETGLTERRGSFMVSASFGKTVLTTKPTHQIDNLVHKSNVLFLNDNDELTLHDMLLEVAEMKPSELENIGKNAKKWYFTNFGDDVFISKLISILDHE